MVLDPAFPVPPPGPARRSAGDDPRSTDEPGLRILLLAGSRVACLVQRLLLHPGPWADAAAPAIVPVASVPEALTALRRDAFDLVLVDVGHDGAPGLEALEGIRSSIGLAAVLLLTSRETGGTAFGPLGRRARHFALTPNLRPLHLWRALHDAVDASSASAARTALHQLQAAMDALESHIAVLDRAGRIVIVNAAWRAFAAKNGYGDPAAGVGTSYLEVCDAAGGADRPIAREVAAAIREVASGGRAAWSGKYACHSPTERRFFAVHVTACHDPSLAVVVHHDSITERMELEEALRSSNERFALVQLATNDVIWDWDLSRSPEAVAGEMAAWEERVHPDDVQRALRELDAALRDGDAWTAEYRYRRGDDTYAAVYDRRYVLRNEAGRAVRLIGSMQDVSEQRSLATALERSEAHYRRLVEGSPQTIYVLDRDGRFSEINSAGTELLQRPAAMLLGSHFEEVVDPADVAAAANLFRNVVGGAARSDETELRIRRPAGEARWVRLVVAPIRDGGAVVGVHGIARDVTDERERASRMRLFAAALENLGESVTVLDEAGRILYSNAAHAAMLGYDRAAPPENGIEAFALDDESRAELRSVHAQVRAHGVWRGCLQMRRMDGVRIPVETHMERVEQDGLSLVFTICRDVSDELEQDHRLRHAERLASLGTLVGGVAHELNNPLAAILGFTQLLLAGERPPADREDLETIRRETERMAAIVADLGLLARNGHAGAGTHGRVDVNDVVRHVLRTRSYALRTHNIEVREELDAGLPAIVGDRGQIEQILLNLVVNAEQSMRGREEGSVLVLRTHGSGFGLSLHVIDNGSGIPPEHLEHVFDPFFTTKAPGEGTGLGLSLVHNMVAEHRGRIQVDSSVGVGTDIRVDFPAASSPEPASVPAAPARSDVAASGVRRLLVVDDEEPVRRLLTRYLTRRGHRVEQASDGAQALALIDEAERTGDSFDLILSDLRMPGMGGAQLLARLQALGTGLEKRLVFLTGDTAGDELRNDGGIPMLTKPIDLEVLGRFVDEAATRGG